ncbi:hypothetical protein HPB47_022970, partial [Ixodes persulcatus]
RSARDRLVGYHDITTYYLLSRRIYPQADKSLSLEQSHVWRQLQTGVFPNPATMTHIHPSLYPTSACPLCGAHANLAHIIWACPQDPFPEIPSEESPDPDLQARLVKRAEEVAGKPRPSFLSLFLLDHTFSGCPDHSRTRQPSSTQRRASRTPPQP